MTHATYIAHDMATEQSLAPACDLYSIDLASAGIRFADAPRYRTYAPVAYHAKIGSRHHFKLGPVRFSVRFRYTRNGKMRFLRVGRLQTSWVWCKE